ncbi:hypothetical protein ACJJTC_006586 [Scirpophaga incertulas]
MLEDRSAVGERVEECMGRTEATLSRNQCLEYEVFYTLLHGLFSDYQEHMLIQHCKNSLFETIITGYRIERWRRRDLKVYDCGYHLTNVIYLKDNLRLQLGLYYKRRAWSANFVALRPPDYSRLPQPHAHSGGITN